MTTVHSRYQILDCTLNVSVTFDSSKALAFGLGKKYALENPGTVVEVFDRMARINCMDTWRFNPYSSGFYGVNVRRITAADL